ncbi:sulfatase-like hydrolase/transferase [Halorientalis regularis]|uniref:Arylsulfatase A n=1 Tax=Halorientalis regularis TaxID=660518 RepID=A0A1G7I5H4_9EURY|nr:sulfatase-like hydrolase/transferase [Halorientalis regularis]SDF07981.1 Arylsulfatase A [Halorientalis regularis]
MRDVVLLTADSVRRDFVDAMPFVADHEVLTGVTAGHYTRPSLAALQSSRLRASVQSRVVGPTIAEAFSEAGYTTIGLVPTAQADPAFGFDNGFDHYDNYMSGSGNAASNRRSSLREYLGSFDIVRQVYRRVYPMEANMDDLPEDEAVIDEAIERFDDADGPRFLWVHQMESHRPYGTGDDAIPPKIDRKAEASGGRHWFGSSEVTDAEREVITSAYRDALGRVDDRIERVLTEIDSADPIFAFAADHGDEFGEEGYYYHQGYRRRVPETVIRVPVVLDGIETRGDRLSLLDVGPTLAAGAGIDAPDAWQGTDLTETTTEEAVTVAPWHEKATVAWQDFQRKLVARDADVSMTEGDEEVAVDRTEVSDEVERQLQDLGYADAG